MAQLAEGYLHLKPFSYRQDPNELGDKITRHSIEVAASIYHFPVTVNIRIEEGSLRFWIEVVGGLCLMVSAYKDFKESAAELYGDAKKFGTEIIEIIKDETNAQKYSVFRSERRTKDIGRIYRLQMRLDKINRSKHMLSKNVYDQEFSLIMNEIYDLTATLNASDAEIIKENFGEIHSRRKSSKLLENEESFHQVGLFHIQESRPSPYDRNLLYWRSEVVSPLGAAPLKEGGNGSLLTYDPKLPPS